MKNDYVIEKDEFKILVYKTNGRLDSVITHNNNSKTYNIQKRIDGDFFSDEIFTIKDSILINKGTYLLRDSLDDSSLYPIFHQKKYVAFFDDNQKFTKKFLSRVDFYDLDDRKFLKRYQVKEFDCNHEELDVKECKNHWVERTYDSIKNETRIFLDSYYKDGKSLLLYEKDIMGYGDTILPNKPNTWLVKGDKTKVEGKIVLEDSFKNPLPEDLDNLSMDETKFSLNSFCYLGCEDEVLKKLKIQ